MVISLAFGAGAVVVGLYNWGSSLYTYNRDAWMTDVQVEQNHCYQSENLKIQMFSMDREEVRDVMQADINKVNNTILVVTLILALAGEMLFEGQVPSSCPAFVLNAYMICLSSAAFHLVLSILFGVFASHEAYTVATDLLTEQIRPDWSGHFRDLKHRKRHELTAAFEEKPASEIFRPPLATRFSKFSKMMEGADADADDAEPVSPEGLARLRRRGSRLGGQAFGGPPAGGSSPNGHADEEDVSRCSSEHDVFAPGSDEVERERSRKVGKWKRVWSESEGRWKPLTTCMFKCGFFGTQNLLEACGYWCLGTLYGEYSEAWAYWVVQIIFVTLNWSMMMFLLTKEMFRELPGGVVAGDHVRYRPEGATEDATKMYLSRAITEQEADLKDGELGVVRGYGRIRDSVKVEFDNSDGKVVFVDLEPEHFDYVSRVGSEGRTTKSMSLKEKVRSSSVQIQHDTRRVIMRWNWSKPWLVAAFPALGPAFCSIAGFTSDLRLDQFCIPMCYFVHMAVNVVFFMLVNVSDKEDVAEQRPPVASQRSFLSGERRPSASRFFAVPFLDEYMPLASTSGDRLPEDEFSPDGEPPAPQRLWANVLHRISFCSDNSEFNGNEPEERVGQAPERVREKPRKDIELQKLPSVLMRCGMGVLIALWFSAFMWALVGLTQGSGLIHVDLKNSQGFLSFSWLGEHVTFVDVFMNKPPSPYFLASAVVCPADKVFVANKFTIYTNVVGDQMRHTQDLLEQVTCDINETILDIDAKCVGDPPICTPILLLHGERPRVFMCRNDGCTGTAWPLLQTNRADKFTTLLSDDARLEKEFATETIEDTRDNQDTLQVANASGFNKGDRIDIVETGVRGKMPTCVRETKIIKDKKPLEGLIAELQLESSLEHKFKRGANVTKEDKPPPKLVASDGRSVLEYRFNRQRGGYVPMWDVAPEAVSKAGNLTALDFSKHNGRDRLVMFHAGGLVVSQDLETGTKCGEWTLPKEDTVVGGGCAYEDDYAMLTLLKDPSGRMTLKHMILPESVECRTLGDANATRCGGRGRLRDPGCPPERE